jgi:hypothetical protein
MSSAFAVAAVTAVLKDLLNNRMVDHNLDALGNVHVTALPPDRIPVTSADEQSQLNLFMYQVTPNSGWRNEGLPSRDRNGMRLTNPPLALDLHYLITAYGAKEFHAEVLLGYAMQLLHENPVLTRAMINTTLKPSLPPGITLPSGTAMLAISDLAEQIELIKICPHYLNNDEMSKLWTAMQAHYRPTLAYQISVVLIQETKSTKTPLPVLMRGKDDRGPTVVAGLTPPYPALDQILLPKNQSSALINDTITLLGHHFALAADDQRQEEIIVQFLPAIPTRLAQPISVTIPAAQRTRTQISTPIPHQPGVFYPAGLYRVSVNVMPTGQPLETHTTNELPWMLAPTLLQINDTPLPAFPDLIRVARTNVVNGLGDVTLQITCRPEIIPEQPVELLLGDRPFNAEAHPAQTDTLTFIAKQIPAGTYRLRLRVDGVESLLIDRSDPQPPKFNESQQVILT